MFAQIRIGRRDCVLRVPVFGRRQIAWVLELTETDVVNRQKRGERLQAKGIDDDAVLAAGALPVVMVCGRRCISPSVLARHPDVAGRQLREDAIAALVEGRMRAPRPRSPNVRPRPLRDDTLRLS